MYIHLFYNEKTPILRHELYDLCPSFGNFRPPCAGPFRIANITDGFIFAIMHVSVIVWGAV